MLAVLLAATSACVAGPAAAQQTSPEPAAEGNCPAVLDEASGVVSLSVRDPARADQRFEFRVDGYPYVARFDRSGTLLAHAPLFHEIGKIDWTGSDGTSCRHIVTFRNFRLVLLTALIWTGPYDLGLRVIEPGGGRIASVPAGPGALTGASGGGALGTLQAFGEPGGEGTHILLYTMQQDRRPPSGELYFLVQFVSRGNPAHPPFCDSGAASTAPYSLVHLDAGRLDRRNGVFAAVPCGTAWSDDDKSLSPPWRSKL